MYNNKVNAIIPITHDFIASPNQTIAGTVTFSGGQDVKKAQVDVELSKLEGTLSNTIELIRYLENKLSPVLVDIPVEEIKDCPRPYLVPVANAVYSLNDTLYAQNNKLQSLINRVEV